jgi:hypothetical protein
MAGPRQKTLHAGIAPLVVKTYLYDSSIEYDNTQVNNSPQVGRAVKLTAALTVGLTTAGSHVLGRLDSVEADGFCTVTVAGGNVVLPKGDAAVTLGTKIVGDVRTATGGYVRSAASGTAAELILARGIVESTANADALDICLV